MRVSSSIVLVGALDARSWVYRWPYGSDGSCECVETSIGGVPEFGTEIDCIKSFSQEPGEYCTYEDHGITDRECMNSVTIADDKSNAYCESLCTELLLGQASIDEFLDSCRFEYVHEFIDSVAPLPGRCFTNFVLGWADYDPANEIQQEPLRVVSGVESAPRCQALCQSLPGCAWFQWRGACDAPGVPSGYQNTPLTCVLYDFDYVQGVLNHNVQDHMSSSKYCDVAAYNHQGCSSAAFGGSTWLPFGDPLCAICGCTPVCSYKSPAHISGPVHCTETPTDICDLRPWEDFTTTTTTDEECTTRECPPVEQECTTHECPGGEQPDGNHPKEIISPDTSTELEIDETTTFEAHETTTELEVDDPTTTTSAAPETTTNNECPHCEGGNCSEKMCDSDGGWRDIDAEWEPEDLI